MLKTLVPLALICSLAACAPPDSGGKAIGAGTSATAKAKATKAPAATEDAPEPEPSASFTATPSDFKLKLKTTSKQCFGEAGCNVEYKVQLTYVGGTGSLSDIPDDASGSITYEVRGPEDGAQVGTMDFNGSRYDETTGFASTKSSSTKLTVRITDVELND